MLLASRISAAPPKAKARNPHRSIRPRSARRSTKPVGCGSDMGLSADVVDALHVAALLGPRGVPEVRQRARLGGGGVRPLEHPELQLHATKVGAALLEGPA